jgi:hypothetical protein
VDSYTSKLPWANPLTADTPLETPAPSFHMPPAFVPSTQSHSDTATFNSAKFAPQQHFHNGQPMHNPQASSGSVVFGGYPDSDNSSPAPLSAGNLPPYPFQQQPQTGRHAPHPSNGSHTQMVNGFSPMAPPPPGYYHRQDNFNNQGPGPDHPARRQMLSFVPADANSSSATPSGFDSPRFPSYDPSTPHSFHGSQCSVPNEHDNTPAFYSQYPAGIANGNNGHIDEGRLYQQPRMKPRSGTPGLAPHPANYPMGPPPHTDNFDGLITYLTAQFADAELADYILELRYSDDRAPPVRIPGHGLLFARSLYLKTLIKAQSRESNDMTVKQLFIESDDRFLRSDSFWMAVQRLYGGPLMDMGGTSTRHLPPNARQTTPMPGTPADRFDIAVGYAAAGHLLQVPPVIDRGVEIACLTVNWDTIEKAIDFGLDGGLDPQWIHRTRPNPATCPSTYGVGANILLHATLNFITAMFPPDFELDASVGLPAFHKRLPIIPQERSSAQNPRLSLIKFGDHPSEDSARAEPNSILTILSKVLLNLPFHLLRFILESPRLGNVEGWANNTLKQKVMYTTIAEREKRRLKVLASPHVSVQKDDRFYDTLHWQEAVDSHGGPDGALALARTWVETGPSNSGN